MNRTITAVRRRISDAGGDRGIVAIWLALLIIVFIGMAAIAVDIARWYVEAERVQKTVDAAALSGAVYMPDNFEKAKVSADNLIVANGWALSDVTVVKEPGGRPSQFRVTMSSQVTNQFGSVLGVPTSTITRTAVADFAAPAPLGSPCNVHGNEPWTSGSVQGSALPGSLPSNCSNYPQFWSTIVGPEVYKTQGDRFSARKCGVEPYQESGCATSGRGGANAEFDPKGYVITIRVTEDLAGPLTVQLYDPAYVETGSRCELLPSITTNTLGSNTVDDASQRYKADPNPISSTKPSYCTGDADNQGLRFGGEVPTVTSFGLIKPTATYNPFDATANAAGNRICTVQYPGYSKSGSGNNAWTSTQVGAAPGADATAQLSQNSPLTQTFHRWVNFCTFNDVKQGDYYLRVRTNVPAGNAAGVYTVTDYPSVVSNGANRFAVRAIPDNASDRGKISVSPYNRMPIFANSNGSQATFNLIRVLPGNAGQSIDFSFYDVGDAAGSGTLSVLPPTDSNVAAATGCTKQGKENGPDPDCSISGIKNDNGWNGQAQQMRIPVPTGYTCDFDSLFGCWWRIKVDFGSGQVTDQTTWTATVDGDPVRLVE